MSEPVITLREVTDANTAALCALSVSAEQSAYVVSNTTAIAEASVSAGEWLQAIYTDDEPAGLCVTRIEAQAGRYFLWRLMIDQHYQRMGFGRRGLRLVLAHVRSRPGVGRLQTSFRRGPDGAQGFYEKVGFKETHEDETGEVFAVLEL